MIGQIIQLQVVDLGCIHFVNIGLDKQERLVRIAGDNDAGKSTVINAIKYAIEGAAKIPQDAIRHGSYKEGERAGKPIDRAYIRLETDAGYIIERVIRKNKKGEQVSELSVMKADSGPVEGGAQTFLDSISSKYPDPAQLAIQSSSELYKLLVEIFDLRFAEQESRIKELQADNQYQRRLIKEAGSPELPQMGDDEQQMLNTYTAGQLQDLIDAANKGARDYEIRLRTIADEQKLQDRLRKDYENLKTRLREIEVEIAQKHEAIMSLDLGTTEHQQQVAEADAKAVVAKRALQLKELYSEYMRKRDVIEGAKAKLEDNNSKIDQWRTEIKDRVSKAELPEGILLTEEGEVMKGEFSWDVLSDSERLKTAMQVACHALPKEGLRYLYIQRGESIGQEKRKVIAQAARDNNVLVFMEVFTERKISEPGVIHIREGEIQQDLDTLFKE